MSFLPGAFLVCYLAGALSVSFLRRGLFRAFLHSCLFRPLPHTVFPCDYSRGIFSVRSLAGVFCRALFSIDFFRALLSTISTRALFCRGFFRPTLARTLTVRSDAGFSPYAFLQGLFLCGYTQGFFHALFRKGLLP